MKILYNHSNMLYPTPLSAPLNNMDPFKHIDKILVKRNSNKSCNNLMKIKIFYHHSNMFYPFSCSASLNNLDTFKHTDKMLQITVDYTYKLRKQLERFSIITLVYLLFFPHLDQSLINWICMLHQSIAYEFYKIHVQKRTLHLFCQTYKNAHLQDLLKAFSQQFDYVVF